MVPAPITSRLALVSADPALDLLSLQRAAARVGIERLHLSHRQLAEMTTGPKSRVTGVDLPRFNVDHARAIDEFVTEAAATILMAERVECPAIVMSAGAPTPAGFEILTNCILRLAPTARALGVQTRLINRHGTRIEQPADLHRLLVELNDAVLAIEIDAAEFHIASVNPIDPIRAFQGRVGAVRLANVNARRPAPLDSSEINIRAVCDAMNETSFKGPIVLVFGNDALADRRIELDCRFIATLDS